MQDREKQQATQSGFVELALPLPAEEQARANVYGLLARLLLAPPDAALLHDLADAEAFGDGAGANPLELAWETLTLTARLLPVQHVVDEYNAIFVSTAAPRISPHASIYLAGFLHEKPLSELRADLARLGLGRRAGVRETEDHLGALCETMRQLIVRKQPIAEQQAFFQTHLASWSATCLGQLRQLDDAQFYARVADLADAFFSIEGQAFEVAEDAA